MSLTDSQLKDLAKKMNIPLAGVYFKDDIPSIEYNKAYIINSEDQYDEDGTPNGGSHWTCFYIKEYPNKKVEGIFLDPFGVDKPVAVKKSIQKKLNKDIPNTTKNIQSLMANCCGYYCLAFLHFITSSSYRTKNLYDDVGLFLDLFDDLDKSVDFKKNEYILKHFFRSEDVNKRVPIEVDLSNDMSNRIVNDDNSRIDIAKIPVGIEMKKMKK